jgi:hypothetical protein
VTLAVPDGISLPELALEVAALLRRDAVAPEERLLTAKEVAERFNVDRGWVYAHARELGVIRIGGGGRPRLRFDPTVVAQQVLPPSSPRLAAERSPAPRATSSLLPITPSRRKVAKGT